MTTQTQAPAPVPIFVSTRDLAKLLGITTDTMGHWAKTCPVWQHDGRSRRRDGTLERTLWHHTGKLPLLQAVVMGTMTEAEAWVRWEWQRARIGHEDVKPNRVDPQRGMVTEGMVKKGGVIPRSAAPPPPDPKGSDS